MHHIFYCLSALDKVTEKSVSILVQTCVSLTVYVFITAIQQFRHPLTGVAIPPVLGVGGSNLQS